MKMKNLYLTSVTYVGGGCQRPPNDPHDIFTTVLQRRSLMEPTEPVYLTLLPTIDALENISSWYDKTTSSRAVQL